MEINLTDLEQLNKNIRASYDALPYFYHVSSNTHPSHSALVAQLHGLTPPCHRKCRVLELACGRGVNLASIAYSLPESECVGIELSERHVSGANKLKEHLGLNNLSFQQGDIMDIGPELGLFDYIIVYGTFSWVPAAVQDQILKLCSQNLEENGVALVHYATRPAADLHSTVRSMMEYHLEQFPEPKERLDAAMEFAELIAESPNNTIYAQYLKTILVSGSSTRHNFYHETLGEESQAFYFHEFMQRANHVGLSFVADSNISYTAGLEPDVLTQLDGVPEVVRREQYADFLLNQSSRSTLLCKQAESVRHTVTPKLIPNLYISAFVSLSKEQTDVDLRSSVSFDVHGLGELACRIPLLSAGMMVLSESWPESISFNQLLQKSIQLLNDKGIETSQDETSEKKVMARGILEWAKRRSCSLRLEPLHCKTNISGKPEVNPIARYQASLRNGSVSVANLRHENVNFDRFEQFTIELLDGNRDLNGVVEELLVVFDQGQMEIKDDGETMSDRAKIKDLFHQRVLLLLEKFIQASLLIN